MPIRGFPLDVTPTRPQVWVDEEHSWFRAHRPMTQRPPPEQGMVVVPAPMDVGAAREAPQTRVERRFPHEGREWLARSAGGGAAGTGALGLALVDAVHFFPDGAERPTHEALTARGRLAHLHDAELVALLAAATPIPPAR